jgi:hypothetical protein
MAARAVDQLIKISQGERQYQVKDKLAEWDFPILHHSMQAEVAEVLALQAAQEIAAQLETAEMDQALIHLGDLQLQLDRM